MKRLHSGIGFLLCILLALNAYAQESTRFKHAVGLELGGNGLAYSLQYERHFTANLHARAGFSVWQIAERQTDKSMTIMSYPISCNYLFNLGGQQHAVETGIGVMNLVTSGDLVEYKGVVNYYLNPFVNAGYRYSPLNRRLIYKIGLSPFIGTKSWTNPTEQGFRPLGSAVQIWGYVGLGYRF